jgi:hypothetical protein
MISSGHWVHLSYHWVNEAGADVIEGARHVLPCGFRPQEETATGLTVAAPAQPGRYRFRLSLVQEGVAWFDQRGAGLSSSSSTLYTETADAGPAPCPMARDGRVV